MHDVARPVSNRPMQSTAKAATQRHRYCNSPAAGDMRFCFWHQSVANRENDEHAANDAAHYGQQRYR